MSDDSNQSADSFPHVEVKRRSFLTWMLVAGAAISPAAIFAKWRPSVTEPGDARRRRPISGFEQYPVPTYVPAGFRVFDEAVGRPDGFGRIERRAVVGAERELALRFRGPRLQGNDFRHPLFVFINPDRGQPFFSTSDDRSIEHSLRFADGSKTIARYFDGVWLPRREHDKNGTEIPPQKLELEWSRDLFHSLTFEYDGYSVGIRAPRPLRVDFDEMIQIASSFSRPA